MGMNSIVHTFETLVYISAKHITTSILYRFFFMITCMHIRHVVHCMHIPFFMDRHREEDKSLVITNIVSQLNSYFFRRILWNSNLNFSLAYFYQTDENLPPNV